jgi:23S rRNA (pseudouridine1915-N3)-methyltransferase
VKLLLLAVGQRQPAWADAAWDDFARRMPPEMRLELKAVKAEPRSGRTPLQCMAAEAQRLDAACPRGAHRVLLSETGVRRTTPALAERIAAWRRMGRDVAFFVGGPDGVDLPLQATAEETLRLSDLTLPHAFVRVLLAEALYRAWTLHTGHPYHRE